jgi:hypothetical protein
MKIKIGETEYSTTRPKGLDKALMASTGCSSNEVAHMLGGQPLAHLVARALLPFLAEEGRPDAVELAAAINDHGTAEVAAKVASLYGAAEPEAGPTEGGEGKGAGK